MRPVFFPFGNVFNATVPHLRAAIIQIEPYVNRRRVGDRVEILGAVSQIAEAIEIITRHKITVVSIEDVPHGVRLKNGSFYGIMGMFERGEIDIFLGLAVMTEERMVLAEATFIEITPFQLLTWSPLKVVDPFNFASAFQLEVWMTVLLTFLMLALICWIMDRYLTPWITSKPLALTEYIWDLFSRFFPQDPPLQDQLWFRPCLIAFLLAFSLFFMTFLSSAITSSMTIKGDEDFVNSFADVLRFPRVRIYVETGTTFVQMFTGSPNEVFQKLSRRLLPLRGIFKLSPQVMELVDDVEAKTRVMLGSGDICKAIIIKKKISSGRCPNVMISTESAGLMTAAIFASRNLPLATRELVRRAVLLALESHIYRTTLIWSMEDYEKCRLQARSAQAYNLKALSLQDVQGCFVLFAIGIGASITSYACEVARRAHRRRIIRRVSPVSLPTRNIRISDQDNTNIISESPVRPCSRTLSHLSQNRSGGGAEAVSGILGDSP